MPVPNDVQNQGLAASSQPNVFRAALLREEFRAFREALNRNAIVAATDAAGRIIHANGRFCAISGYGENELIGRTHGLLNSGHHAPGFFSSLWRTIAAGETWHGEICNRAKSGELYWVDTTIVPLKARSGTIQGYVSVRYDVTERKRAELALAEENARRTRAEALLRHVIDAIPVGISAFDAEDRLLVFNEAYRGFYPAVADEIRPGARYEDIIRHVAEKGIFAGIGSDPAHLETWIAGRMRSHRRPGRPVVQALADGRWMQVREFRTEEGLTVTARTDITELKEAEQTIRKQAAQDPLTGLSNRSAAFERVERLIGQAAGLKGALVLIDLDNFKAVNDSLGHDAGDELLVVIGRRLAGAVRKTDMVARMGGDEFALVLTDARTPEALARRLGKVMDAVQQPVALTGRTIQPRLTMGVALFETARGSRKDLFRHADIALYQAKSAGRGRFMFFDSAMLHASEDREARIEALRLGIGGQELRVVFQPQVSLQSGQHVGFEALVRWNRSGEWVQPADFVPLAEDSGLIVPLGTQVLEMALDFQRTMKRLGLSPGRMAVNVAAAQLKLDDFPDMVAFLLAKFSLLPEDLEIEVTETALLDRSANQIARTLERLHGFGIAIALDDFGTGYASLAHLKRFKVDRLKIDRSFVSDISMDDQHGVIARTIVSLAHSLAMDVVAEGVETQLQCDILRSYGCDVAQGFLFARPMAAEQAEHYLAVQMVA